VNGKNEGGSIDCDVIIIISTAFKELKIKYTAYDKNMACIIRCSIKVIKLHYRYCKYFHLHNDLDLKIIIEYI
jgi:hypothetical protein